MHVLIMCIHTQQQMNLRKEVVEIGNQILLSLTVTIIALSALTVLVGHEEERLVCKNLPPHHVFLH